MKMYLLRGLCLIAVLGRRYEVHVMAINHAGESKPAVEYIQTPVGGEYTLICFFSSIPFLGANRFAET